MIQRDLTEQKRAEQMIARDSLLLANVRDSVIVTDPQGIVTYWNRGATRLFGWTAEEMLERPLIERYPEPERVKIAERIEQILAGQDWQGEFQDWRKDGSRVWIDARVARMLDSEGQVIGVLGIAHDISERKQAEAEKNQALWQLNERVKELSTMRAVAAVLRNEDRSLKQQLDEVANLLPLGWQYPDVTAARVSLGDLKAQSPNFRESPWKLTSGFVMDDGREGVLDVFYLEERPPAFALMEYPTFDEMAVLKQDRFVLDTFFSPTEIHLSNRPPPTTMQPETAPDPQRELHPKRNH